MNDIGSTKKIEEKQSFWPYGWWKLMDDYKIGVIPLPLFIIAGLLILTEVLVTGKLPSRSGERRVGEEDRCLWVRDAVQKKRRGLSHER